ncbi:MAG: VCBS repeat-containing protein [Deltaproteobacteria bacterium]|nr:VCBS repeat-containing protein [Deltaproteobacteria bacterium]
MNITLIKRRAHVVLFCLFILLTAASTGHARTAKVALLPLKINAADNAAFIGSVIADLIAAKLSLAGEVIRLKDKAVPDAGFTDEAALEAAKTHGADWGLLLSLTVTGQDYKAEARLVNALDGSIAAFSMKASGNDALTTLTDRIASDVSAIVAKTSTKSDDKKEAKKDDDFLIRTAQQKAQLWKSERKKGAYIAMAQADVNKDGTKELLLLSGSGLYIAIMKPDGLETIKEIQTPAGVKNFSLTVIDADKDGKDEIYVSGISGDKPSASVIEFIDNDYKITASGIQWAVRAMQASAGEAVLVGQSYRPSDGFYGTLYRLEKKGSSIAKAGEFEVQLSRGDLFRVQPADMTGSGQTELVLLDDRGFLKLYKKDKSGKWEQAWKGRDFYGGTLNLIEQEDSTLGASSKEAHPVEGRFFIADYNKDGRKEVILKRNYPGGLGRSSKQPRSFIEAEVISLSWHDGAFEEDWKTKKIEGYIADFVIEEAVDGTKKIIMLVVEGTEGFSEEIKSYVLSHRLVI